MPMAVLEIMGKEIRIVSGFLAEVGDTSHFNNLKEQQKPAGLALVRKMNLEEKNFPIRYIGG